MDDITASMGGQNKELSRCCGEGSGVDKEGGNRKKGLKLSISEIGKEGKEQGDCAMQLPGREVSGMQQQRGGVGFCDQGAKEKARMQKCDARFSFA